MAPLPSTTAGPLVLAPIRLGSPAAAASGASSNLPAEEQASALAARPDLREYDKRLQRRHRQWERSHLVAQLHVAPAGTDLRDRSAPTHTLGPNRDSRSRCHSTRSCFGNCYRARGRGLPRCRAGGARWVRMLRLAKECVTQTDSGLADDAISANVRDFALNLGEKPAL
jgi:hypothetical protein